jgi:hypothetical protein
MKPTFFPTLSCLVFLTQLSLAQENSQLFSQYVGAPTATAVFDGPSASEQSQSFTICTNYLHELLPIAILNSAATSMIPQLEQIQVDGVCQFCTSVQQSRIDSCCAQPTSVDCFEQFAAQATPTTGEATATANPVTVTGGASIPANTKTSNSDRVDAVGSERSFLAVLDANDH